MICPHCAESLLRRRRTGSTCSECHQVFALDPKTNPVGLHDLRMRRLVAKLTDPDPAPRPPGAPDRPPVGPVRYTAEQLRHAAARPKPPKQGTGVHRFPFGPVLVLGAVMGLSLYSGTGDAAFTVVLALLLLGVVGAWTVRGTGLGRRFPGVPISPARFAALLDRWTEVYGAPPPGLLPPRPATPAGPDGRPRSALLCLDPYTIDFLVAAGVADRLGVLLVPPGAEFPPEALRRALHADPALPVLALHDADPAGVLLPSRLRAALPAARIVEVGLAPRQAMRAGPPVLRRPDPDLLAELTATARLTGPELTWLRAGRTLPLAAVRPARLLRAVERAAGRAAGPERARAATAGFLDGPEAGP